MAWTWLPRVLYRDVTFQSARWISLDFQLVAFCVFVVMISSSKQTTTSPIISGIHYEVSSDEVLGEVTPGSFGVCEHSNCAWVGYKRRPAKKQNEKLFRLASSSKSGAVCGVKANKATSKIYSTFPKAKLIINQSAFRRNPSSTQSNNWSV